MFRLSAGPLRLFLAVAASIPLLAQTPDPALCPKPDGLAPTLQFDWRNRHCLTVEGGVTGLTGSFVGLSYSFRDLLKVKSELGVRSSSVELGLERRHYGVSIFDRHFTYDQNRNASILSHTGELANSPEFTQFLQENLVNYSTNTHGYAGFLRSAHFRLTYSYEVDDVTTYSLGAQLLFLTPAGTRSGKLTPSYEYRSGGKEFAASVGVAGLGGDINTVEPAIRAKYERAGFKPSHVAAWRVSGRMLIPYNGQTTPPQARYYLGGEDEIRGFASWTLSPAGFLASAANVQVLNNDGTPRQSLVYVNSQPTYQLVSLQIPAYRSVSLGGDTKVFGNFEYRIPLNRLLTAVLFTDAGFNRLTFRSKNSLFPQFGVDDTVRIAPGSQRIRMSTGAELQVNLPKLHAPIRLYWAYNAMRNSYVVQPPILADRSYFPNAATFESAIAHISAVPPADPRFAVRLAIGRTF
jgi:outer membrane protein insertion porin family